MRKILGFVGALIFILYFYGFAGLLRIAKQGEDKSYAIYAIMILVNVLAWFVTKNLIIKYF